MKFGNMSRLAKKPFLIPAGVSVVKQGEFYVFKGPKGEIKKTFSSIINVELIGERARLSLKNQNPKNATALLGTSAALFKNYLKGVSDGFEKKLEIEGVGYKVQAEGSGLVLSLGFTHPIKIQASDGIVFKVEKNQITVSGIDKEKVGCVAAEIRAKKPPEPYKGKGIHYIGEIIRRKAGKKAVAAA